MSLPLLVRSTVPDQQICWTLTGRSAGGRSAIGWTAVATISPGPARRVCPWRHCL